MPRMYNKHIVKSMPILLPLINIVLWCSVFILHETRQIPNTMLAGLPLIILQIVISWECGSLIKRLNYGANNDELTGLYNRHYLNIRLGEEIERVKRTQAAFSLILIDVDNFKQVNDTYGHLMGDKVLAKLGGIFKNSTRSIDIVSRWGGEEFAIIMPETDSNGSKAFAERLRKTVEDFDFGFQVTISLGIVSDRKDLSLDELLTQADEALYCAKEKKNRVVIYEKPALIQI